MSNQTEVHNHERRRRQRIHLNVLIALMSLFLGVQCFAVDWSVIGPSAADKELGEYFRAETAMLRERCLAEVKDVNDWKARREVYRTQLLEMLGLDPLPEKTDLKAVVTGKVEHDEFTVEKIYFQLKGPAPAILYVCGHGGVKKNGVSYGNKVRYQHHAAWFARNGYVCMVIDSLQLGEIEAIHHGTYRYKMWWWNCRGYSPAGVEAWNCIRALDYLETREEVDKERFGVTGRSGGGAYSWWISTIDERIKAAVPVAGIADLENHVVDGCVEGHCDCMYFVNTYRWDYLQLPALVAPRPLIISNTDKDRIFPLDGVMRTYLKTMEIYNLYGAGNKLGLHICEGPHKDTQQLRIHAFVWFNRFLKEDDSLIDKPAVAFFEPEELKVFETLPEDQINTHIHDSFVPKAPQPAVPETGRAWKKLRNSWTKALKEKVFRGWPTKKQAGRLQMKCTLSAERDGLHLSTYDFNSQRHVRLRLYVVRPADNEKTHAVILNVLDDETWRRFSDAMKTSFPEELGRETLPDPNAEVSERIHKMIKSGREAVAFFAPRGIGPYAWNGDERKQTQIRRRFMLLGQTVDGMRVWDVRRAIGALRSVERLDKAAITVQGRETMAGIALYATLFERNIERVNLIHPSDSHREGPIFLNVLRFMDIPEAAAMAAEHTEVRVYPENDGPLMTYPKAVAEELGWPEKQYQELVRQADGGIFGRADDL